jgi:hypothetical protein
MRTEQPAIGRRIDRVKLSDAPFTQNSFNQDKRGKKRTNKAGYVRKFIADAFVME